METPEGDRLLEAGGLVRNESAMNDCPRLACSRMRLGLCTRRIGRRDLMEGFRRLLDLGGSPRSSVCADFSEIRICSTAAPR